MKLRLHPSATFVATLTTALIGLTSLAQAQTYLLKPYPQRVGEVVVIRTSLETPGGSITVITGDQSREGTISKKRTRVIERRVLGSGATQQLQYIELIDQIVTHSSLAGTKDSSVKSGPLVGKVVNGFKDDFGHWRLYLKKDAATHNQAKALTGLEAYSNRQLFRQTSVKVGETWLIEPSFIRNVIERDMGPVDIDATMTFTSIQDINGEKTAVLNFTIKSNARKNEGRDTRITRAIVDLKGTLYVSLTTMLDKKLEISGSMTTSVAQNSVFTMVQTPVQYKVEKSIR